MRKALFKIFIFGAVSALMCLFYGFLIEPKTLKIRQVSISVPNWTGEPLKIGLVSDLHIGGFHMPPKRMAALVDELNGLAPDMVLIAGDFVSGHDTSQDRSADFNAGIERGISHLAKLDTQLGVYSAIGNHDDWYNGALLTTWLTNSNVDVLENTSRTLDVNGSSICLVGLPDSWTGEYDKRAFDNCRDDQMIVTLMHSPDSFQYMRSDTDLALTGHTHGGQINIPLIGRRVTATEIGPKFAYGIVNYNGIPGFVTAGVGTSILPARFRAPPELVLISLSGE